LVQLIRHALKNFLKLKWCEKKIGQTEVCPAEKNFCGDVKKNKASNPADGVARLKFFEEILIE
jgi:hypothetical protein